MRSNIVKKWIKYSIQVFQIFLTIAADKGLMTPSCIPYLSSYDDCNDDVGCKGCNRCTCTSEGQWSCYTTMDSCGHDSFDIGVFGGAEENKEVSDLINEMTSRGESERQERINKLKHIAPPPPRIRATTPPVLDMANIQARFDQILSRNKRSADTPKNITGPPVKFYNTVDDLYEDTLKNSNVTGTLNAPTVDLIIGAESDRNGILENSTHNPLHIAYNEAKLDNDHIADNKIDTSHAEDKYDAVGHSKLSEIMGNHTEKAKAKDLSKVVVNELKSPSEIIGDAKGPILTNITFTPKNDTLTAMAFIAGNLLNKLWNMEKDIQEDSLEMKVMKHQKITDLLELFKEPMTYRQELFLKNALEKISDALYKNKNIQNISLCGTVEEVKKELNSNNSSIPFKNCEKKTQDIEDEKTVIVDALSKLNNVLSLINKFENVQKNLHSLKHSSEKLHYRTYQSSESDLSKDEQGSLNVFGKILEKVSRLLIPHKNSRIIQKVRHQNILSNTHDIDDQFKKTFGIDLGNTKLTSKDKVVLDYISQVQKKPCLMSSRVPVNPIRSMESDILLNLSEFFKIKSYSDLLKLVGTESSKPHSTTTPSTTTTQIEITVNHSSTTDVKLPTRTKTSNLKERLKVHLKTILNDLIEIQNETGGTIKPGEVNVADALPCLFNILKENKPISQPKKFTRIDLVNKVKSVLSAVKKEAENVTQNRRSMTSLRPRPKSVVLWERLAKNLARKTKLTRRSFNNNAPKLPYEKVKNIMEQIETNNSNTYKQIAYTYEVSATNRIVLLKTLELDVKRYLYALENLQMLNDENKLPAGDLDDINEFVDNAAANINLDKKVLMTLNEPKQKLIKIKDEQTTEKPAFNPQASYNKRIMKQYERNNEEITRDQIYNELIKRRIQMFLKMRELEGVDITNDIIYNIASRILTNLEIRNDKFAQELFKVFIELQKNSAAAATAPLLMSNMNTRLPKFMTMKQPLSQFQESNPQPLLTQDQLIKQLLNIKKL